MKLCAIWLVYKACLDLWSKLNKFFCKSLDTSYSRLMHNLFTSRKPLLSTGNFFVTNLHLMWRNNRWFAALANNHQLEHSKTSSKHPFDGAEGCFKYRCLSLNRWSKNFIFNQIVQDKQTFDCTETFKMTSLNRT